jgi:hypothetical protein
MTSGPDIILGVSRAADTVKQREAAARLERLSRGAATNMARTAAPAADLPSTWPAQVHVTNTDANSSSAADAGTPATSGLEPAFAAAPRAAAASGAPADAYVQFEAVLLQKMVETMMPQDSEAMFGSGTAGTIWKSMLAEKVAMEIAQSGVLGIAKQIAAGEDARSSAAAPAKVNKA